jgi:hypothetical protein
MKLAPVKDDAMIWTRRKPMNPEVISLIEEIRKQPNGTYEVTLDNPVKTLNLSLKPFLNASVKAKDKTGKHWYIRTAARRKKKD